jgi:hypothetical protein
MGPVNPVLTHIKNNDITFLPSRIEILTVMNIQFAVFWVVTLCNDGVAYGRFEVPCCFLR